MPETTKTTKVTTETTAKVVKPSMAKRFASAYVGFFFGAATKIKNLIWPPNRYTAVGLVIAAAAIAAVVAAEVIAPGSITGPLATAGLIQSGAAAGVAAVFSPVNIAILSAIGVGGAMVTSALGTVFGKKVAGVEANKTTKVAATHKEADKEQGVAKEKAVEKTTTIETTVESKTAEKSASRSWTAAILDPFNIVGRFTNRNSAVSHATSPALAAQQAPEVKGVAKEEVGVHTKKALAAEPLQQVAAKG